MTSQGDAAGVVPNRTTPTPTLTEIRARDAATETYQYSWPCLDRHVLLALLDEERAQYISLVGQTQEALDARDTALASLAAEKERNRKLVAIVERWLICCDLAGVDAERDGAIPDNPSLNPYVQLLRDSRALLTSARSTGDV
jgi:hypothetical protein